MRFASTGMFDGVKDTLYCHEWNGASFVLARIEINPLPSSAARVGKDLA